MSESTPNKPTGSKVQKAPEPPKGGAFGRVASTPPAAGGKENNTQALPKIAASERVVIKTVDQRLPPPPSALSEVNIDIRKEEETPVVSAGTSGRTEIPDPPALKKLQEKLDATFPPTAKSRALAYYDPTQKIYRIKLPERIPVKDLAKLGLGAEIVASLKPSADYRKVTLPLSVLERTLKKEGHNDAGKWLKYFGNEEHKRAAEAAIRSKMVADIEWMREGYENAVIEGPFDVANVKEKVFVIDKIDEKAKIEELLHGEDKKAYSLHLSGVKTVEIRAIYIEKAVGLQPGGQRTI